MTQSGAARPSPVRLRLDGEGRFVLVGTFCLALLLLFGFAHHELWRDEAQAWWLARRSPSFWSLLGGEARRYEGHPFLWFFVLRAASKFSTSHLMLSLVSFLIALANGFLLLGWRAFPRWQRALFAGSYFVVFEYGVLARSYGLALLLLLVAVRIGAGSVPRPAWLGVAAGLAANTTLAASIPAAILVGNVAVRALPAWLAARRTPAGRRAAWGLLAAPACFLGLLIFAKLTTPVPPDAVAQLAPWPTLDRALLVDIGHRLFQALVPIPDPLPFDGIWWNTNAFLPSLGRSAFPGASDRTAGAFFGFAGYALAGAWIWTLRGDRIATLGLAFGFAATLALVLRLPVRAVRFEGHLVLCLLTALAAAALRTPELMRRRPTSLLIGVTFGAGVLGTGVVLAHDAREPFSQSLAVARYLERNSAASLPVAGVEYYRLAPVAAYLDREFYSAEHARVISHGIWSTRFHHPEYFSGRATVVRGAACWALAAARPGKPALLIITSRWGLSGEIARDLELMEIFAGSQPHENYTVYRVHWSERSLPDWCGTGGTGRVLKPGSANPEFG